MTSLYVHLRLALPTGNKSAQVDHREIRGGSDKKPANDEGKCGYSEDTFPTDSSHEKSDLGTG